MCMHKILASLKIDLKANADEKTLQSFQRFFKEKVVCYGVKTATVGKIAKKYWSQVELLEKKEIFGLCEELFRSRHN